MCTKLFSPIVSFHNLFGVIGKQITLPTQKTVKLQGKLKNCMYVCWPKVTTHDVYSLPHVL